MRAAMPYTYIQISLAAYSQRSFVGAIAARITGFIWLSHSLSCLKESRYDKVIGVVEPLGAKFISAKQSRRKEA
jgi:hypothetical protein